MRSSSEKLLCSLAGIAIAGLLAGCGDDSSPSATSTSVSGAVTPEERLIAIRPVVGESAPPCSAPSPPAQLVLRSVETCLALGAAGFDSSDVASARVDPENETYVWLVPTESGKRRFDEMAAAHLGRTLAAVANSRVVMNITIDGEAKAAIRSGSEIFVTGFTETEAAELVSALRAGRARSAPSLP